MPSPLHRNPFLECDEKMLFTKSVSSTKLFATGSSLKNSYRSLPWVLTRENDPRGMKKKCQILYKGFLKRGSEMEARHYQEIMRRYGVEI
jgi:hypothetical protein